MIELTGVVKTLGPVRAVDGIDLAIAPRELFGLIGRHGAGKNLSTIHISEHTRLKRSSDADF
ncbi:hypothetical protein CF645_37505 [Burkholderia pseudomallei]|nr:hypothetical protein CF645_37500 [Burkholderia pseudomallei]PNX11094.1 hypothetical protein CF645_37505 [Burkholderia pseudomallei]